MGEEAFYFPLFLQLLLDQFNNTSMKPFLNRLTMTVLTTVIVVIFSEKMYWFPQGYVIGELILFYGVMVYVCLWALDYFRVKGLAAQALIAALFAFLVEGILTPVLFEGGPFDPFMPAYFIGWHGGISWIFGVVLLRTWLVEGRTTPLVIGCTAVGIMWGLWSLTYWLPGNAADFAGDARWSIASFSLYALAFTSLLIVAHALLGSGGWVTTFKPSRWEKGVVVLFILFFYATLSFPAAPLGWIKLGLLLAVLAVPLTIRRERTAPLSNLRHLQGHINPIRLPILLLMPALATAVYGLAEYVQPADDLLLLILELHPLFMIGLGIALLGWGVISVSWPRRPAVLAPQGD